MTSIADVFSKTRDENRAALIAYLPAGYPDQELSHLLLQALIDNGVDLIEIGFPYSDPLMDGPIIQAAVQKSLDQGSKAIDVFSAVERVSSLGASAVVMSYFNPIFKYGLERFAQSLTDAGGAGVITPDLIPDEATQWLDFVNKYQLNNIFLVAPSSTDERIAKVSDASSGFIYAASLMGVTGVKLAQQQLAADLVQRVRRFSSSPIAVGLGVNTPEQAQEIARYADGVIVGSAFIKKIASASSASAAISEVGAMARALSAATKKSD